MDHSLGQVVHNPARGFPHPAVLAQDRRMTQPSVADLTHTVPDGIISAAQLRTAGVTTYAMSTRCRPSGPWQRLLPGVILLSRAEPTRRQRLRAALVYLHSQF